MSVEIVGTVVGVLGGIALITWRFWPWVEQIQREQREDPLGSKRWHWPAVAFLALLVVVSVLLLRFAEDPR